MPTIRHLEGRRIGAEGKPVDPWGVELGLHRGGNCWTWRHDALKNMVAADIAAVGLDCLVEVISIFAPHIPPAAYTAARKVPPKRRRGLVPDGALRGWGHGSPEARPGWQMFEVKTLNVNLNASNAYRVTALGTLLQAGTSGVERTHERPRSRQSTVAKRTSSIGGSAALSQAVSVRYDARWTAFLRCVLSSLAATENAATACVVSLTRSRLRLPAAASAERTSTASTSSRRRALWRGG